MKKIASLIFAIAIIISTNSCSLLNNENTAPISKASSATSKESQQGSANAGKVSQLQPTSTLPKLSSDELKSLSKNKVRVALMLPLSGKNKDLGTSLLNAASMSIFDNDNDANIELVLVDSKDSAAEATKAFASVLEQNIKIVIGPLFSAQIESIEKDARQNKITVLSLSNNQQLMGKVSENGGVFIAGMIPESQADRMIGYALSQGKRNFAVIAPANQYGTAINLAVKETIRIRSANLITSEFYNNSSAKEISRAVQNAINSFRLPPELNKDKNKKGFVVNDADRIFPDVIIIAESGKNLSKIAAEIKKQNSEEREFKLMGTSQWDDLANLEDPNLVGSWFISPESEKFRNFEYNYQQLYKQFPPRLSSIVYDMVAIVSKMTAARSGKAPSFADFINQKSSEVNGFSGIDGTFRFLPNGLVQRNFAVIKISNGKFETIDKPAEKFLKY